MSFYRATISDRRFLPVVGRHRRRKARQRRPPDKAFLIEELEVLRGRDEPPELFANPFGQRDSTSACNQPGTLGLLPERERRLIPFRRLFPGSGTLFPGGFLLAATP
jgi:hypothetical protein